MRTPDAATATANRSHNHSHTVTQPPRTRCKRGAAWAVDVAGLQPAGVLAQLVRGWHRRRCGAHDGTKLVLRRGRQRREAQQTHPRAHATTPTRTSGAPCMSGTKFWGLGVTTVGAEGPSGDASPPTLARAATMTSTTSWARVRTCGGNGLRASCAAIHTTGAHKQ